MTIIRVRPGCRYHHSVWSGQGLGVGVTIVYGWARVPVSPSCRAWPGAAVTIVYNQARVLVLP